MIVIIKMVINNDLGVIVKEIVVTILVIKEVVVDQEVEVHEVSVVWIEVVEDSFVVKEEETVVVMHPVVNPIRSSNKNAIE